jgi:eukaryotic-like serine/threonine-protein kinase
MNEASLPSLGDLSDAEALQVEQACSRFEQAWRDWQGRARPDLLDALGKAAGPVRAVQLAELLRLELVYRRQTGERPTLAEYLARLPGDERLLRSVFHEAVGADQTTMGESTTKESRPGGLAGERVRTAAGAGSPVAVPGYAIEGVLGKGAMGIVYKARHLALKRTVALKMILAGGHAPEHELARFKAEAEVVARLQHPNILTFRTPW